MVSKRYKKLKSEYYKNNYFVFTQDRELNVVFVEIMDELGGNVLKTLKGLTKKEAFDKGKLWLDKENKKINKNSWKYELDLTDILKDYNVNYYGEDDNDGYNTRFLRKLWKRVNSFNNQLKYKDKELSQDINNWLNSFGDKGHNTDIIIDLSSINDSSDINDLLDELYNIGDSNKRLFIKTP